MTLHEAGDRLVRGAVLDLKEGQGRASAAPLPGTLATTHSHVEVGRDHHGFHHQVAEDDERNGRYMGDRG